MPGRHLDMIAEHAIVADLERGDSGLLTVAGLQPGNRPPPLAAGGAQDVERGVITLGDIAALGGIDRRRRDQDRKSTRLNSRHQCAARMPSSACKQKTTS